MNVEHLRYFLVLAEELHYSRAAEQLNISQSGLSHAVSTLEKELGVPLFHKNGRSIELGPYGEILLPEARHIVSLNDRCVKNFRMMKNGKGTIRVRSIPLLVLPAVVNAAKRFKERNPLCDFTFCTGMSDEVCRDVKERRADIGFCSKITPDSELEYAPIQENHVVIAVPAGHPLCGRERVSVEETLPYPHITYSALSGQREQLESIFAPYRDRWRVAYEVEDVSFILELVSNGFGIAALLDTRQIFRPALNLEYIPLRAPNTRRVFSIVRRNERHPLTVVDEFYDFFVREAAISGEAAVRYENDEA